MATLNPEFFRPFDFSVTLPGESQLKVKVSLASRVVRVGTYTGNSAPETQSIFGSNHIVGKEKNTLKIYQYDMLQRYCVLQFHASDRKKNPG